MTQRHSWTQLEDQRIILLVQKYGAKNWTVIASEVNKTLQKKNHRSAKQCRQRWHNHLDKQINKNSWTQKQEKILFEYHKKYGNKWTQIAKYLEGRTDNSIKNHFYSTLRKGLRRINKQIGSKKSTVEMGNIKPSVLSKILCYAQKDVNTLQTELQKQMFYNCQDLSELLLTFSNVKQNKEDKMKKILNEDERKKLEKTIHQILSYNTNYEKEKAEKIRQRKNLYYREQSSSEQSESEQEQIPIEFQQKIIIKPKQQKIIQQPRRLRDRIKRSPKKFEQPKLKKITKMKQPEIQKKQSESQTKLQLTTVLIEPPPPILKKIESQMPRKENDILNEPNYDKRQDLLYEFPDLIQQISEFQIPTPRLEYLQTFSPKPPTPMSFFRNNESKYWLSFTQQQLDNRYNQTKTSIYSNNKNIMQQKQDNYNKNSMKPFITPSPRSAFKLY